VTTVSPLEASSADLGGGRQAPALVVADWKIPSPLFALVPGLLSLYAAAPFALVFVLGLLQAQWTYTGYDASAHVAEETVMARLNSAWGVFLSFAISAVVGYALLLVLTWSIPNGDVAATATLYLAYVIPIWLNWLKRLRRRGEYATRVTAPWSLGRFGPAINTVAILWVIVITVVFALPPNELVLWTMLLLGGLIALYWWLSARRRFVGPDAARR
jgi:amino acid transporter